MHHLAFILKRIGMNHRIIMAMFVIVQCNSLKCPKRGCFFRVVWLGSEHVEHVVRFQAGEKMSSVYDDVKNELGATGSLILSTNGVDLPTGETTASDAGLEDGAEVEVQNADTVPYLDIGKEKGPNEATLLLSLLTALSISIGVNVGLCTYILCRRIESKKDNINTIKY
eukprot:558136_1